MCPAVMPLILGNMIVAFVMLTVTLLCGSITIVWFSLCRASYEWGHHTNPTWMESSLSSGFAASSVLQFSFLLLHALSFTHCSRTRGHCVLTLPLSISSWRPPVCFYFLALQAGLPWEVLLLPLADPPVPASSVCTQQQSLGHRA